jgi:polysaccharide pyruvyl transferase WcaK-like protein
VDKKLAALINFTGNSYHWGCHGTSLEVYQTLLERGYYVEILEVEDTHSLSPTPELVEHYDDAAFLKTYVAANPRLARMLANADVVVVNGEGTLHRTHKAPLNLLYLMYVAKKAFRKQVHLINHSFFPNGDAEPNEVRDRIYGGVARALDRVVPREALSRSILERLGVKAAQGFDCLPRFIERHKMTGSARMGAGILVSGGVAFTPATCAAVGKLLKRFGNAGGPVMFLTGAKGNAAREDAAIFAGIKGEFPAIELADARSMRSWLECIGAARCLVSGRYHHTLAAASLGVPFMVLPSNTPKIEATLEMLGAPDALAPPTDAGFGRIGSFIDECLAGNAKPVDMQRIRDVVSLSGNNFDGL